jgi:hypothetical protein
MFTYIRTVNICIYIYLCGFVSCLNDQAGRRCYAHCPACDERALGVGPLLKGLVHGTRAPWPHANSQGAMQIYMI